MLGRGDAVRRSVSRHGTDEFFHGASKAEQDDEIEALRDGGGYPEETKSGKRGKRRGFEIIIQSFGRDRNVQSGYV